jgi:hypothetical protein
MRLSKKAISLFIFASILPFAQCAPKKDQNNDSDQTGMGARYQAKWFWFIPRNVTHYVFFAGRDSKVGDYQCWYEAISKPLENRRPPDFMQAESKPLHSHFLHIPTLNKVVELEKKALLSSGDSNSKDLITLLEAGMKRMLNDKKDAQGKRVASFGPPGTMEKFSTEKQAKSYADSIKAVISVAMKNSVGTVTNEPCLQPKEMEF